MRDIHHQVRELGSEIIAIGSGQPFQAKAFAEERGVTFPLLVDPALTAYRLLEMKRPMLGALKPSLLRNAWRALRSGLRQGRTQGDAFQNGGALVIGPAEEIHFRQVSDVAGDHASPTELLAALEKATARR